MLNVDQLKEQIQTGFKQILTPAIERILLMQYPEKTKEGSEMSKNIADTFEDIVAESLAEVLANAIDSYIKNIAITGTVITVGGPATQTAQITSMPTPITNGKVPNTLGIS